MEILVTSFVIKAEFVKYHNSSLQKPKSQGSEVLRQMRWSNLTPSGPQISLKSYVLYEAFSSLKNIFIICGNPIFTHNTYANEVLPHI